MRNRYFYIIIFLFFSCSLVLANGPIMKSNSEEYLKKLFEYAKSKNVQAVENLRSEVVGKPNAILTIGYSLSLYIAAPERYEEQYIDNFPTDFNGIMTILYNEIELKQLTPTFLYSIDAIGKIALKGNEKAVKKVLIGAGQSDGAVGEIFCDYVNQLLYKQLHKTLAVLLLIDVSERKKSYDCFKLMSQEDILLLKKKIKKTAPVIEQELQHIVKEVIQELNRNNQK